MAVFNPQIQPSDVGQGAYFKWSEPITQPKADTSTGLALDTLGTGIEGATKLADQTVKGQINEDVYNKVDTVRNNFTSDLEAVKASIVPAPVQTAAGSTVNTQSLTDSNPPAAPVPAAIDVGLGKADALQSALVNGKINDTYYTQRLNSVAKDLRTQYPGYREYIDQKISEVTGVNPANAYIRNLMEDINRQSTAKDTEFNKTETRLTRAVDDHTPGSVEMLNAWRARAVPQSKVEEFLYTSQNLKSAIDLANAKRQYDKGTIEDIKTQRTSDFTNEVGASLASNFSAMTTIPGTDTPQGILDFMKVVAAHPEQYSSAMLRTLDSQITTQKAVFVSQFQARAAQVQKDAQGKSYSYNSDIGAGTVKDTINSIAEAYDTIHNALTGGGPEGAGLAYLTMNQVKARFADRDNAVSMGPVGQTVDTFKILNDKLGPAFAGVLAPKLINSPAMGQMADLFTKSSLDARAQPDFNKDGKPLTYMDHQKIALQQEADGKINAQMRARYQAGLVKIGEDIQDPKMPDSIKANVVKYLFSPEGQGLLGTFKTDYVNSEGKTVPGKYAVFNALTSQGMVENITKLAKADPTIGTMYKNYLENEAGSQLFYKEFQNLNRYTGHDDLHFQYNDGADKGGIPFISLIDRSGKPVVTRQPTPGMWNQSAPGQDPEYLSRINESVGRVNQALAGMGRVEKGLNGDVNAYVLNFLQHAQVNMGQNWTGLPAKLADAIAASRAPQQRIDQVFKDIK